jgi:hypothetical protein
MVLDYGVFVHSQPFWEKIQNIQNSISATLRQITHTHLKSYRMLMLMLMPSTLSLQPSTTSIPQPKTK